MNVASNRCPVLGLWTAVCCAATCTVGFAQPLFDASGLQPPAPAPAPSSVRGIYNPRTTPGGPITQAPAPAAPRSPSAAAPAVDSTPTESPSGAAQLLEGGQIIARIDGQVVLASDVLWQVNQLIDLNIDRIPPGELATVRESLLRRQTVQLIDSKLLFADFRRMVPPENLPKVRESLREPFREVEVPRLLKVLELETVAELETKMEGFGASLRDVEQQFIERTIASQWLQTRLPKPKEVTRDEMLAYYHEHLADYEYPAQARWEELMVRFDRHEGDADAAWRALAEMGNEVWANVLADPSLRGPVFATVAKARSHGFTAANGGVHDWTTIGALRCEALNEALRELKIGQLSDGIASERGFHIVRVLERKDAGRTPFTIAQAEIRETLQKERRQSLVETEIKRLRSGASVWTLFHGDLTASQLNDLLSPQRQ